MTISIGITRPPLELTFCPKPCIWSIAWFIFSSWTPWGNNASIPILGTPVLKKAGYNMKSLFQKLATAWPGSDAGANGSAAATGTNFIDVKLLAASANLDEATIPTWTRPQCQLGQGQIMWMLNFSHFTCDCLVLILQKRIHCTISLF